MTSTVDQEDLQQPFQYTFEDRLHFHFFTDFQVEMYRIFSLHSIWPKQYSQNSVLVYGEQRANAFHWSKVATAALEYDDN